MFDSKKNYSGYPSSIIIALSMGLVAAFWIPTIDYYFWEYDAFQTFMGFSKARLMGNHASFIMQPQNQHFMPAFQLFFFLQWKLFGLEPIPYHIVSIALLVLSALLLWRIILSATGHALVAGTCALAYATNSAYYTLLAWVYTQPILLMFIFIEVALLAVQSYTTHRYASATAALFCLIASLSFSLGVTAWLICGLYMVLMVRPPEGWSLKRLLSSTWPLAVSGTVSLILMMLFTPAATHEYGSVTINPGTYLNGTILLIGAGILQSIKGYYVVSLIPGLKGLSRIGLLAVIYGHFALAAGITAILARKLPEKGRRLALFGLLVSISWCIVLIAMRTNYYGDLLKMVKVTRHSYFALAFLTIAAAPFLTLLPRKAWRLMPVALIIWTGLHLSVLLKAVEFHKPNIQVRKNRIAFVSRSLDYPVHLDAYGRPTLSKKKNRGSRQLVDYILIKGTGHRYIDALWMFLSPGELIAKSRGNHYLLRNSRELAISKLLFHTGDTRSDKSSIHVSSDIPIEMSITPGAIPETDRPSTSALPYAMLLRLHSGRNGHGLISCGKNDEEDEFTLPRGKSTLVMTIMCDPISNALITLPPGTYSLADIRGYW